MQSKTNLVDFICLDLGPSALFHLHLEPAVLKHVESRVSVGWCCVHCSSWNDALIPNIHGCLCAAWHTGTWSGATDLGPSPFLTFVATGLQSCWCWIPLYASCVLGLMMVEVEILKMSWLQVEQAGCKQSEGQHTSTLCTCNCSPACGTTLIVLFLWDGAWFHFVICAAFLLLDDVGLSWMGWRRNCTWSRQGAKRVAGEVDLRPSTPPTACLTTRLDACRQWCFFWAGSPERQQNWLSSFESTWDGCSNSSWPDALIRILRLEKDNFAGQILPQRPDFPIWDCGVPKLWGSRPSQRMPFPVSFGCSRWGGLAAWRPSYRERFQSAAVEHGRRSAPAHQCTIRKGVESPALSSGGLNWYDKCISSLDLCQKENSVQRSTPEKRLDYNKAWPLHLSVQEILSIDSCDNAKNACNFAASC